MQFEEFRQFRERSSGAEEQGSQAQTTEEEEAVADTSRLRAEFRVAVVGHLVVGDDDRGQLVAELKSLAAKKWKHPITGARVTFSYSTIEHWYYVALNNPKARLRALSKKRRDAGLPRSLTKQMRHYLDSVPKTPFFRATLIARHNSARTSKY